MFAWVGSVPSGRRTSTAPVQAFRRSLNSRRPSFQVPSSSLFLDMLDFLFSRDRKGLVSDSKTCSKNGEGSPGLIEYPIELVGDIASSAGGGVRDRSRSRYSLSRAMLKVLGGWSPLGGNSQWSSIKSSSSFQTSLAISLMSAFVGGEFS